MGADGGPARGGARRRGADLAALRGAALLLTAALALALVAGPARAGRGDAVKVEKAAAKAPLIGKTPSLYGRLTPLRFGMSRAEAEQAAPGLFDPRRSRLDMVIYGLEFDDGAGLREVAMHFLEPQKGVRQGLTQLWGPPRQCDPRLRMLKGQRWWVWLNARDKLRVMLRESASGAGALHFAPYMPLAQHVGEAGGTFGFEARSPVVGVSLETLRAIYRDELRRDGETWVLDLAAHEFGQPARVHLQVRRGVVQGARFALSYAHCGQAREAILAALEARFGVFAPPLSGGAAETLTAGPTRVRATDTGRAIVLEVGAL